MRDADERAIRERFEETAAKAFERLPERIRAKVRNVAVIVEDRVSEETVRAMSLSSDLDLLGLYTGSPLIDRDYGAGVELPDVIHLFRLPIQMEAEDSGKTVDAVVYETLWHEIAHHFGMDEDMVERREREEFGG